ncbi:unnamed protein product [Amoebophrya sp. A120]|nr:unnamed protein product [Amoebophrya sp. A120]CAD7936164.1 unnamed protein product [Amoebophrya sp. A120]|eukprot:GSA120T00021392001.1
MQYRFRRNVTPALQVPTFQTQACLHLIDEDGELFGQIYRFRVCEYWVAIRRECCREGNSLGKSVEAGFVLHGVQEKR